MKPKIIKFSKYFLPFVLLVNTIFVVKAISTETNLEKPKNRPTVALVLSGGIVRGLAHIGVLKYFEDKKIPIDYVAGTSMGSLIGGMYSLGYSADEIECIVDSVDMLNVLSIEHTYEDMHLRRKQDLRHYGLKTMLGFKGGLSYSTGLLQPHRVGLLIDRITFPYTNLSNFDQLPVPFRSVAVDMEKGTEVILKDGSLASALRSSMALPALFSLEEHKGKTLGDGGLLNNLPTDIAKKEFNPDIIIAVDVTPPLLPRNELKSPISVANQSVTIFVLESVKRNLKIADMVIAPDFDNVRAEDFTLGTDDVVHYGYSAAKKKEYLLKGLMLNDSEWKEHLKIRQDRRRSSGVIVTDVIAIGGSDETRCCLEQEFSNFVCPHNPIDIHKLEYKINDIVGKGKYEHIGYELSKKDGKDILVIRIKERQYGPPFLNMGAEMTGNTRQDLDLNFGARITQIHSGCFPAETRMDFSIGSRFSAEIEHYMPIGQNDLFFAAPRAFFINDLETFQINQKLIKERIRNYGAGVDFGLNLSRCCEFRLGGIYRKINADEKAKQCVFGLFDGDIKAVQAQLKYDDQDNPSIPTKGIRAQIKSTYYHKVPGVTKFQKNPHKIEGDVFYAHGFCDDEYLFHFNLGAGTTCSGSLPLTEQFILGGPFNLSQYVRGELRGDHYAYGHIGFLKSISKKTPIFVNQMFWGVWLEAGGVSNRFKDINYNANLMTGLVVNSLLGPVFIGTGLSNTHDWNLHFTIGKIY